MPYLQPDEQEVYPPHNHVFQVVLALRVLKLNMQTILNAAIHFYNAVGFGRLAVTVDPDVLFAHDVLHSARDGDAQEIAEFDVDAMVGFVGFLDVFESEGESNGVLQLSRGGEFGLEGEEFMVGVAVKVHFCPIVSCVCEVCGGCCSGALLHEPIVPTNWTLMPVCSNLLPSFGRIVTAPFTVSPSR